MTRGSQPSRLEAEFALLMRVLHQEYPENIPLPVREFQFCPARRWRADFAWPEQRLLVEIEGGLYIKGGGRHQRHAGFENDCIKYNAMVVLGYRCLRFTGTQLKNSTAARFIQHAFDLLPLPRDGKF